MTNNEIEAALRPLVQRIDRLGTEIDGLRLDLEAVLSLKARLENVETVLARTVCSK